MKIIDWTVLVARFQMRKDVITILRFFDSRIQLNHMHTFDFSIDLCMDCGNHLLVNVRLHAQLTLLLFLGQHHAFQTYISKPYILSKVMLKGYYM